MLLKLQFKIWNDHFHSHLTCRLCCLLIIAWFIKKQSGQKNKKKKTNSASLCGRHFFTLWYFYFYLSKDLNSSSTAALYLEIKWEMYKVGILTATVKTQCLWNTWTGPDTRSDWLTVLNETLMRNTSVSNKPLLHHSQASACCSEEEPATLSKAQSPSAACVRMLQAADGRVCLSLCLSVSKNEFMNFNPQLFSTHWFQTDMLWCSLLNEVFFLIRQMFGF